jgi:hypothetical protein
MGNDDRNEEQRRPKRGATTTETWSNDDRNKEQRRRKQGANWGCRITIVPLSLNQKCDVEELLVLKNNDASRGNRRTMMMMLIEAQLRKVDE